jgi:multisite-specific tRNA:(cytosine-C5)-methyltransferase
MSKRAKISPEGLPVSTDTEAQISSTMDSVITNEPPAEASVQADKKKGWNERVTTNADWEIFYKKQRICDSDEEFALMKETFLAPLPVGIKVNTSSSAHGSVEKILDTLSQLDDSRFEKCRRLTWSLDGNCWQWSDISRVHVRKDPSLIQLKKWLVDHEQIGTLTRQEAVSMIPPIALSVQPGDLVLDMCAAPGSKTCQLLEMVGETGTVVANDVEWKRANMLSHQVQRLCSPANLVTNVDASSFPAGTIQFSKILCDVPCTGDGTIRKSQDIWRRWSIVDGINLHARQLQILCRGLTMLKEGGSLVYSTCSLNPIENEAVVAAALNKIGSSVRLVAMDELPGLQYKSGLGAWEVFDDRSKEPISFEAYRAMECENKQGRLRATMFPEILADESIRSSLGLTRRFLPHLMNTGGFYVAKFEKIPSNSIAPKPAELNTEFVPISTSMYENLIEFYGIDSEKLSQNQLFMHKDFDRHIYFVSKTNSELIRSSSSAMKIVSVGVRAFADIGKWESNCPFRLTQEGVHAFRHLFRPDSARVGFVDEES